VPVGQPTGAKPAPIGRRLVWSLHQTRRFTCEPADPASKGGSESTVKLTKADLVPKDTKLRPVYASFAELERACDVFCEQVNTGVHRVTRRAPADMLADVAGDDEPA
jgi:hypothetical protein